jgi:energy-coupling factor transporter transmembrane protein EcfT
VLSFFRHRHQQGANTPDVGDEADEADEAGMHDVCAILAFSMEHRLYNGRRRRRRRRRRRGRRRVVLAFVLLCSDR